MQRGIAWPEAYEPSFAVLHAWCRCEQAPSPRGDDAGDATTTAWVNKRRCALMEGCAALMLVYSVAGHSQQHSLHLVCVPRQREQVEEVAILANSVTLTLARLHAAALRPS